MRSLSIAAVALLILAGGCFKQRSIVGNWQRVEDPNAPSGTVFTLTFQPSGSFGSQYGYWHYLEDGTPLTVRLDTHGTYAIKDYLLEMNAKQVTGTVFDGNIDKTPDYKSITGPAEEAFLKSWANSPNTRFEWIDDDNFKVMYDGVTDTFRRQHAGNSR